MSGISLVKEGKIGVIQLNMPPANSYNLDNYRQLNSIVTELRFTPEIKVAIIVSETPKFFSAGADLSFVKNLDPVMNTQFCLLATETLDMMSRSPQVYIACIEGHCVGGGLEMALGCDLRFAGDKAGRFGLPEVNLGMLAAIGGTQRLARQIGKSKALDLCLSAELVGPEEALSLGMIDRLFPQDEVRAKTMAYAEKLANGPAYAVEKIKLSIINGVEMPLNVGLRYEAELSNLLARSQDAQEGLAAFLEKRTPNFQGK